MTAGGIGTSAPRAGDANLVRGAGRYVADVSRPGEVWARVVRSPAAHARLNSVDTAVALRTPGVLAVVTAADVPDVRLPIRLPFAATPEAGQFLQPLLARDVVRYVGEPVAVVVGNDAYVAEDAAELVALDLDVLEAAVDPVGAAAPGAPLVHAGAESNVVNWIPMAFGDIEAAFARADVVVRHRLAVQRHTAVPLETRGLVAERDEASGRLTIWGAAKVKHFNRGQIAALLGIDPGLVRLVENDVGGGFGVRGELYPEDLLIPFLALELGRPVKWVEDRAEHLVATNHAREQVHELEVAASSDGRLLAFRDAAWCDQGAYVRTQGLVPALLPASHLPGPYAWEAFEITTHAVLTHRTPVGTYRGPGMTEATFVRERALDTVAAELRLDPAELRRRNLIRADAMPFVFDLGPAAPPLVYESGDFPAAFERLLAEAGYERLRAEGGESVGIGLAAAVEMGGVGPFEDASLTASADGTFVLRAGVASLGQGVETVLAQIAADELGVPTERVVVHHHDTDDVVSGFGSFASRSTVVAGNAAALAARAFREVAAAALAADPADVDFADGVARVRSSPGRAVAAAGLGTATARFEKEHPSFSFGAALSVVSVDRSTGRVEARRHVVAHDVGRAVNPALLRGQLAGAAAQGIAGALLEELAYDADGNPLVVSLADYLMPTAAEVPPIETIVIESEVPGNPLGVKGGGEAGMVTAPAAVANAVADALGDAGRRLERLPLTPPRVRELLRGE